MSDNLYENLHFGNEEENTTEKPVENVSQENAAPAEPIAQETAEVSEQPERTEVYSDSSFLQGSQADPDADKVVTQQTVPYGNPDYSQPQSQPQPYVDPYQPAQSNAPDPAQDTALVFLVDRGNDHSDVCMRLRHVASPPILRQVSDKNVWDTYPIILYKHKQCNGILCTIHERGETAPIP